MDKLNELNINTTSNNNNKNKKQRTKDIELDENVLFDDLILSKPVLDGLKQSGFYKPSPIQLKAIPLGKLGLDLIVQAKSGTGKTCVFSVIALEHVLMSNSKALQVLILAPTREVALQICNVLKSIGHFCSSIKINAFIGGNSLKEDKTKIKSCQIAIGTPGRILHLMKENLLVTTNLRLFILDEADKLLAPEFQESINSIYSNLPDNKQMIALSATYPYYLAAYVTRYMRAATFVRLNIVDPTLRGIKQYFKITPYSSLPNVCFDFKVESLLKILSTNQFQQAIIFTNYQLKAESLCKTLTANGWPAIFISGSIEQSERNNAISQLKQFKCRILVSTDLTSRGIDAENVDLVVCMDVPSDAETYLHRIGRAGRYGSLGLAVSFVCEKEEASLFENIIETYHLRIKQFNEDLNDVISERNKDGNDEKRIDDVTIERVTITREDLDKSLFEYEKLKQTSRKYNKSDQDDSKTQQKHQHYQQQQQNSYSELFNSNNLHLKEIFSSNNLMGTIEEDFEDYKSNKKPRTTIDLNQIQQEYETNLKENYLDLFIEDIINLKTKFQNELKLNINKSSNNQISNDLRKKEKEQKDEEENVKRKNEMIDLRSLYKWQLVDKNDSKSTSNKNQFNNKIEDYEQEPIEPNESNDDDDLDEDNDVNNIEKQYLIYSYYFKYYHNYYLNQLLNQKQNFQN